MNRFLISSQVIIVFIVFALIVTAPVQAVNFPIQGARSQGMGGAAVAEISDENALTWNPANLNIRPDAFDIGIHGSLQLQSTKDIQKELQDLVDFEENVNNLGNVVDSGDFSDTETTTEFIRLVSELRDVTRDGQGILGNITAGLNGRKSGFGIMANNFTSFSVSDDLNLDQALIGGSTADSSTTRQFITGDTGNNSAGGRTLNRISNETVNTMSQSIDRTLNARNLDIQSDLGFSPGTTSDDLANEAAFRVEKFDPNGDTVTDKQLRNASKTTLPNIVALADTGTGFDTEDQKAIVQGISVSEFGVSYSPSPPLISIAGGELYGGMNLKYMRGEVGYFEQNIFEEVDENDLEDNVETTNTFGVDVGFLYDHMDDWGYRVGLMARNINGPEFDYPDTADTAGLNVFEVEPHFRLGLAAYPLRVIPVEGWGRDWWKMSMDYDLTSTGTTLPSYDNQYIALGNEFNIYNRSWLKLAFRAGLKKNLEESSEGTVYSGGIGLNVFHVQLDLSGVISDKKIKDDDGSKRPTVAGGGINLSYRF